MSHPTSIMALPLQMSAQVVRLPDRSLSDAALARAALAGDTTAPIEVWERFSPVARAVLRRTLGCQDVEDHVQEVFLVLFRELPRLRELGSIRCFLYGIAIRVAKRELRSRRYRKWLTLTDHGELPEIECRNPGTARDAVRSLYGIVDQLDDESRIAFLLRHVEGLELDEVAEALEISLATTKRRLEKATERVRRLGAKTPALASYIGPLPQTEFAGTDAAHGVG